MHMWGDQVRAMGAHSLISSASVPQLPRPAPPRFSVSFLSQEQLKLGRHAKGACL